MSALLPGFADGTRNVQHQTIATQSQRSQRCFFLDEGSASTSWIACCLHDADVDAASASSDAPVTRTLTRRPFASMQLTTCRTRDTTPSLMLSLFQDRKKPAWTYGRVPRSGVPRFGGYAALHACRRTVIVVAVCKEEM